MEKGKRTLFITPRRNLTFQAYAAFEALGIEAGIIMSGVEHDNRHMVEVASLDTIISRIGKDTITGALLGVESADVIIIDEAHQSVSAKRKEFLLNALEGKYATPKRIIGLTASPCVNGGGGLGAVYDDLLIPTTMHQEIEDGHLLQPRYFSAEKPDLSQVKVVGGDYTAGGLGAVFDEPKLVGDIVHNYTRIAGGTTAVCFAPTRKNAAHLAEQFEAAGYPSAYLDANTPDDERKRVFDAVAAGEIKIITNVLIVGMGTDIPRVQTVICATATKSIARWVQAVGRALRPYEGQEYAYIIDHGGMCIDGNMGPVEDIVDWSLAEKEKIQDRALEAKQERKEPKEIECSSCGMVFKSRRDCPACGHVMKQECEPLEVYEADLSEIKRGEKRNVDKINRQTTPEQKEAFFGGLKSHAQAKGYSMGWASHAYKEKFGVWPNKYKNARPVTPNQEVLNWIRYKQIQFAKRSVA